MQVQGQRVERSRSSMDDRSLYVSFYLNMVERPYFLRGPFPCAITSIRSTTVSFPFHGKRWTSINLLAYTLEALCSSRVILVAVHEVSGHSPRSIHHFQTRNMGIDLTAPSSSTRDFVKMIRERQRITRTDEE